MVGIFVIVPTNIELMEAKNIDVYGQISFKQIAFDGRYWLSFKYSIRYHCTTSPTSTLYCT